MKKLTLILMALSLWQTSSTLYADDIVRIPSPTPNVAVKPKINPIPPKLKADTYILLDADSGRVLAEHNAKVRKEPASLTKMMSMLVVYDHIKSGQLKLDDSIRISKKAWSTTGSKMFLRDGQYATVEDLIKGIIIVSANDASVALAEHIAGSIQAFTQLMNAKAKQIGMHDSHFHDPIGFSHPEQYTTAYDLAILSRVIIKNYPDFYPLYKEKWYSFNAIKQPNRNRLLWRLPYVDGIKTGHTDSAGYVLAASGEHEGMRLIAVTMNSPSDEARASDSKKLLTFGYRFYESRSLYKALEKIGQAKIWYGHKSKVPVGIEEDLVLTIDKGSYKQLDAKLKLTQPLKAPLKQGAHVGQVEIFNGDDLVVAKNIVVLEDVKLSAWYKRMWDGMLLSINRWFGKEKA